MSRTIPQVLTDITAAIGIEGDPAADLAALAAVTGVPEESLRDGITAASSPEELEEFANDLNMRAALHRMKPRRLNMAIPAQEHTDHSPAPSVADPASINIGQLFEPRAPDDLAQGR